MFRSCYQKSLLATIPILLAIAPALFGVPILLDFEGLNDGTFVTTQYSGITVSNAIILTSGISLNELDFPPLSGVNAVSDAGGAMSFVFSSPVLSFLGHITYTVPVTIQGFDLSNTLLASSASLFATNTVSGGDPGSAPNELLQIASAIGFSMVVITGDPSGGSFALDDVTYTVADVGAVPEPASVGPALLGLMALFAAAKTSRRL